MFGHLHDFFYDRDKFKAAVGMFWLGLRGLLIGGGTALAANHVDLGPTLSPILWKVAPWITAAAGMMSHGQKNLSPEQVQAQIDAAVATALARFSAPPVPPVVAQ
jgi:hypothetical protein